ncbi:MAG TPA: circadian clock KaiB family protein [Anaerolineales bacterium]|nr:circadian clock KaiB family protein [Anaerolineales bacterium]
MKTDTPNGPTKKVQHYALRLFVAGNAANSQIARENLERLRARYPDYEFEVEVIDLNIDPEVALTHGIFISPALQVIDPPTGGVIYGNLSDERVLERVLKL